MVGVMEARTAGRAGAVQSERRGVARMTGERREHAQSTTLVLRA